MVDHNPRGKRISENDAWTFHCDKCGLPFMQSKDFHNEEYHNGNLTSQ